MADLNEIYDDELELGLGSLGDDYVEPTPSEPINDDSMESFLNSLEESDSNLSEDTLVDNLLKTKGIDPQRVILIDEDNTEKEVNFYDLSREEQLEILNSSVEDDTYEQNNNLSDEEEELINHLRSNNLTLDQFLDNYKDSIVNSLSETEFNTYEIDAYNDDELYMLDLKNKFDLSDDELIKELEKESQDPDLFKRKVDKLREEYKTLEDEYKETQRLEFEQKQQERYDQFAQEMVEIAGNTPEFYGIELEDNEKNEVLSFLLELDDNGTSEFAKALNDPKKLYEAAWFLKYGKASFDLLKSAYEAEISKLKVKDKNPPVIRRSNHDNKTNSIHDLI